MYYIIYCIILSIVLHCLLYYIIYCIILYIALIVSIALSNVRQSPYSPCNIVYMYIIVNICICKFITAGVAQLAKEPDTQAVGHLFKNNI